MNTFKGVYVSDNKFQFITDFSQHTIDIDGETKTLDFGALSITERIILSSYLTYLCMDSSEIKNNKTSSSLYNIIFHFNYEFERESIRNRKTSYYESFIRDLTVILKDKVEFFTFIKKNYSTVVDNKTLIYRQQLNRTEMDLLYSLKFQRNYKSLMNVLYILGVSKQNIGTEKLNKIHLDNIYSSSTNATNAKKRINAIFEKINSVSNKKVNFIIKDKMVYFSPGFSIDEDEKFYSTEKINYENSVNEKLIIDYLTENEQPTVEQTVVSEPKKEVKVESTIEPEPVEEELIQYEEPKRNNSIDIGEGHATMEVFQSIYDKDSVDPIGFCRRYLEKHFPNLTDRTNWNRSVEKDLLFLSDSIDKMLNEYINNPNYCFKNDPEWQTKKATCEENVKRLANKLLKVVEEYYDEYFESNIIYYKAFLCSAFILHNRFIKVCLKNN